MAANVSLAGASSTDTYSWNSINWKDVEYSVKRLQMRIAKATREGRHNKVKALQWLLTRSFDAKLLAVKRVTQNRGARTAGVDGQLCNTQKQKQQLVQSLQRRGYHAKPLRRVYIPKRNGQPRPLGIPTIKDRAMQALYLLALQPIAETTADIHSYGFRPERSTADAIEQCFRVLSHKTSAKWILECDIQSCFDEISHDWLKLHVPMDKRILSQWLSAGYMEKRTVYPTWKGTPQGGVASPTLANMTLDGLEQAVKTVAGSGNKVHVIRYADDFVITGATKQILEEVIKPAVSKFLSERGLTLSEKKTKITHIDKGFDFLGHHVRKYKGKLLIKPSKANVKIFLNNVREIAKCHIGRETKVLINHLNPKIRGWAYYYRHVVSKNIYGFVDDGIYRTLANWVKRRHPDKNKAWWRKHYYRCQRGRNWIFTTKDPANLGKWIDIFKMKSIPIKRHLKIIAKATPYDPAWKLYFQERNAKKKLRGSIKL